MRLSADPTHPDYNAAMLPCRVYLDEVEVKQCLYLDTNESYVICAALNEAGEAYTNGDEIATEVRYGEVRIEPIAAASLIGPHE